jgi:hypothetical protein
MSVAAIIAAPMITLYVQRKLEDKKARDKRRQEIFNTLWINRRRPYWLARIDALNMIDLEFYGEPGVQDAWQALRADYFRQEHPGMNDDQIFQQREELFATLLFEISKVLRYKFSRTDIRDNIYRPQLHGTVEEIEIETRARILALLRSDALPVRFVQEQANSPQTQATLRQLLDQLRTPPQADRN